MAGNGTTIDLVAMQRAVGVIATTVANLETNRTRARGDVAAMAAWQGSASQAFAGLASDHDLKYGDILLKLMGVHDRLVEYLRAHGINEAQQITRANQIRALI